MSSEHDSKEAPSAMHDAARRRHERKRGNEARETVAEMTGSPIEHVTVDSIERVDGETLVMGRVLTPEQHAARTREVTLDMSKPSVPPPASAAREHSVEVLVPDGAAIVEEHPELVDSPIQRVINTAINIGVLLGNTRCSEPERVAAALILEHWRKEAQVDLGAEQEAQAMQLFQQALEVLK